MKEIIGVLSEETEVKIKMTYILRLKHYTDRVRNTADNSLENKMAVISLLGYLEALETLNPPQDEK